MTYVWLAVGFALIVKGSDLFVDGASRMAQLWNVPMVFIGLTVVAFGTNAPELAIMLIGNLEGNADIAMANLAGSNILNITLVIGLSACIREVTVDRNTVRFTIPCASAAAAALFIAAGGFWGNPESREIGPVAGTFLLALFALFIVLLIRRTKRGGEPSLKSARPEDDANHVEDGGQNDVNDDDIPGWGWGRCIAVTLLGLGAVVFGSELTVNSAEEMAAAFGMSQALIGATVVAIGTALPEIVIAVTSSLKNKSDLSTGNVLGSNIFNFLLIVGLASLIVPVTMDPGLLIDIGAGLAMTLLLWLLARSGYRLTRAKGLALVACYLVYMAYVIMRN